MQWALIVVALAACGKRDEDAPEKVRIDPVPTSSEPEENTKQKPAEMSQPAYRPPPPTDAAIDGPSAPPKDPYAVGPTRLPGRKAIVPRATLGTFKVTGALPPEVVHRIVRQNLAPLQYCYEKTLRDNPQLKGEVIVHFTIAATGVVTAADIKKSLHPDVDVCIADRLRQLIFPKPEHDHVDVDAPMTFSVAD